MSEADILARLAALESEVARLSAALPVGWTATALRSEADPSVSVVVEPGTGRWYRWEAGTPGWPTRIGTLAEVTS